LEQYAFKDAETLFAQSIPRRRVL